MKSITKGIIIFSAICFFLGIALCIIGAVSGARLDNIFNEIRFDGDYNTIQNRVSKSFEGVENIELDIDFGDIDIVCSDEFKVDITSYSSRNKYSCDLDNGTLKIKVKNSNKVNLGRGGISVVIYVPYDTEFGTFKASVGACDFNAEKISAHDVDIEVGAGDIEVSNLTSNKCIVNCGVGSLNFKAADIKEKLEVECGVGETSIALFGTKNDFNYDVDCALGEVSIDKNSYSTIASDINHNNLADKNIEIDCSLGEVDISFINE